MYRSREEEEEQKTRCPIRLFGRRLSEAGILGKVTMEEIDTRVHGRILDAERFAREDSEPEGGQEVFVEP